MRGLARAQQPARKCIFAAVRTLKSQLMRAKSNVCHRLWNFDRRPQPALPRIHLNAVGAQSPRRCDVLAAGKPRCRHSMRSLKKLVLGPACDHTPSIQHLQVRTESKRLLHIVRDKYHRSAETCQRSAQLLFGPPAQVRIERREGLVEQQRIRLHRKASCNGHHAAAGRPKSGWDSDSPIRQLPWTRVASTCAPPSRAWESESDRNRRSPLRSDAETGRSPGTLGLLSCRPPECLALSHCQRELDH